MEKIQITEPQSLGVWFSECQQKWNIGISHHDKSKNDHHFINIYIVQKKSNY